MLPNISLRGFGWIINGTTTFEYAEGTLDQQGIVYSNHYRTVNNRTFTVLYIEAKHSNNDTLLGCEAFPSDSAPQPSHVVVFRVQGKLLHIIIICWH